SPLLFILLLLGYNMCYMPTLSLANTLVFHTISNREKQFPVIRVFGTLGWITAGLGISFVLGRFTAAGLNPEQTALPLYLTAGASLLLGLYGFTLPHVPPPAAGRQVSARSIMGIDALKQLGSTSFYVFLLSSLLICIPLSTYYAYTQIYLEAAEFEYIAATQTFGQMSEILFMLLMPLFFSRLGVKWMLAIGMFAWVLRYSLFALGAPEATTWMILSGIILHGICYDFFFVTGQIYMDKKADPGIRGQAQGLIIFVTYGVGMLIGTQIAGLVYNGFLGDSRSLSLGRWQDFWLVPAGISFVVMLLFSFLFRERVR
ncbi:MAG TPA: MFS transporter, partial [Anseongella sp.]|nr:MFS transporter [Anseongella sp.]